MLIKLKDYERIYKTVNAILVNEKANTTVACMYYSAYGAYILSQHYKIDARPVAGLATYQIGSDNNILVFGERKGDKIISSSDVFHCWVQADDWLIDFMSPIFPKIVENNSSGFSIAPKMMQKPLSSMANSILDLNSEGDFFVDVNPMVTKEKFGYLSSRLAYTDLKEICSNWYRKPPKKMQKQIIISDVNGIESTVSLVGKNLVGSW